MHTGVDDIANRGTEWSGTLIEFTLKALQVWPTMYGILYVPVLHM